MATNRHDRQASPRWASALLGCAALLATLAVALPQGLFAPTKAIASAAAESEPSKVAVVGGSTGDASESPWMAAIVSHASSGGTDAGRQFCGGSLIASRVVLTAAHCVASRSPEGLQVVLGRSDLKGAWGERIDVSAILAHPLFVPQSYRNDVALLQLAEPSQQPVATVAAPSEGGLTAPWTSAKVMGWGSAYEGGPSSPLLRAAQISILPNRLCSAYGGNFLKRQMLCAGTPGGGTGSCSGDSGGPLSVVSGGQRVVGIVSWAAGCARPGFPTVFTRLGDPSINAWVRAAAASLAAGHASSPPPRTVVRKVGLRARNAQPRYQFVAPGETWASFQCSSKGGTYRVCPTSARARSRAVSRGALRVRALDIFGSVDPTPATVDSSKRR